MEIAALAGGVGASKLLLGLSRTMDPSELTVIVNTGDDILLHGLSISPDLDIVTYTLADLANPNGLGDSERHISRPRAACGLWPPSVVPSRRSRSRHTYPSYSHAPCRSTSFRSRGLHPESSQRQGPNSPDERSASADDD